VSRLDLTLDPKAPAARRIEVITGAGGRRRWSDEEKARTIEESLAPDAVVSQVARRHGATPQQLFTWRREARRKAAESSPPFVPAIMEGGVAAERAPASAPKADTSAAPVMEIEVGDAHVWIWRDADLGMATAILRALQTAPRAK
jgi:transposase